MTMKNVTISVIIPNYNHSRFLEQRIESVLSQTYHDYDVIILDDCSTDCSLEILRKYERNEHVSHIVVNQTNSGSTFRQWEKGLGLASGEYIWIAESDDYADKDFLSKAIEVFEKNHSVTIAVFQSNIVDENGKILHYHSNEINNDSIWKGQEFIRSKMMRNNVIVNASSVVFKKNAIPENKEFTKYRYCGDWLFWCEVISKGDVYFVSKYYNYFRMHSNKVTPNSLAKGLHYTEGIEFINKLLLLGGVKSPFLKYYFKIMLCYDMQKDIYLKDDYKESVEKRLRRSLPFGCFTIARLFRNIKRFFR